MNTEPYPPMPNIPPITTRLNPPPHLVIEPKGERPSNDAHPRAAEIDAAIHAGALLHPACRRIEIAEAVMFSEPVRVETSRERALELACLQAWNALELGYQHMAKAVLRRALKGEL